MLSYRIFIYSQSADTHRKIYIAILYTNILDVEGEIKSLTLASGNFPSTSLAFLLFISQTTFHHRFVGFNVCTRFTTPCISANVL